MRFNGWRIAVAVLAVAALGVTTKQAEANQTFILQGVTLAGGGTLTGSFVTDDTLANLLSANITSSVNGAFTGFNFVTPASTPSYSITFLRLDATGRQVQLAFAGSITNAGASLTTNGTSFETQTGPGNRLVTAGRVTNLSLVAPEPSSLAQLAVGGLCGLGVVIRKRRKKIA
jgi:hypothetical protein